MAETRKTLFLYPNLFDFSEEERGEIFDLIESLKFIVNKSNTDTERILRNGSFEFIRCLPTVNMEEAHSTLLEDIEGAELVRICVISYNNRNYEKEYASICESYTNNTLKISHLVGLKINSKINYTAFSKPENSPFDVVIETNPDDLDIILTSIMLDISIYHYFALSNDIQYRKNFSLLKMEGIKNSEYLDEYGNIDFKKIKYLPFSYPYVKKLPQKDYENNKDEYRSIISKLLHDFFQFILNTVCYQFEYNNNKELNNPYNNNNVPSSHFKLLDEVIGDQKYKPGNNYIIVIEDETEDTISPKNVIFTSEYNSAFSKWVKKFSNPLNNHSLYYITIGDK